MTSATPAPAARTRRRRAKWHGDGLVLVARLSVDEKDNDPKVLLTYIAAAQDAVQPVGGPVFDTWPRRSARVPRSVTSRPGSAFAAITVPVVLSESVRCGPLTPSLMQPNGSCVPYPVCGTQGPSAGTKGPGVAAWRLISLSFACLVVAR